MFAGSEMGHAEQQSVSTHTLYIVYMAWLHTKSDLSCIKLFIFPCTLQKAECLEETDTEFAGMRSIIRCWIFMLNVASMDKDLFQS